MGEVYWQKQQHLQYLACLDVKAKGCDTIEMKLLLSSSALQGQFFDE